MGHLYRSLNLAAALHRRGLRPVILVNDDAAALRILKREGVEHEVVDLAEAGRNWEGPLITRLGLRVWINDRLDTAGPHAARVKAMGIPLVTFDDRGSGAVLADLHIAALAFDGTETLGGARLLAGPQVLILNPDIARHRRLRQDCRSLLVTLGGSDTWGVTVKVVRALAQRGRFATVVVGPNFAHHQALAEVMTANFVLKQGVPSMIEEMARHDLAITGGGITPFEANAAGLPCIVVANETFEIPVGQALEQMGGAVFAGFRDAPDFSVLDRILPIEAMSRAGMERIGLDGLERVAASIGELVAA